MSSGLLLLLLLALSHLLGPVHCGGGDTEPTPPPIELHPSNLAAAAAESAYSSFEPASLDLVLAYATADNETYVKDLFELVSIPSISALPDHAQDVLSAAEWLKKRMLLAGLENVQVLSTEGPQPVVSLCAQGCSTPADDAQSTEVCAACALLTLPWPTVSVPGRPELVSNA